MSDSDVALANNEKDKLSKDEIVPESLKYHLLGPSLTKAGQETVDQSKVSDVIYHASKGSKFFTREEVRDQDLTRKIEGLLTKKFHLETLDLTCDLRTADRVIDELESSRDLSQHIAHIDCDAFYAAVEQLEHPELKYVPFAVGEGVLTTCNYVARKFGCRSGMAGFVAKKLCPPLVLIRPNFCKYSSKAQQIREILANYDPQFESASIDEAYLNVTKYCHDNCIEPAEAVEQMRREIREKTGITVSAGIAANARLAKICSNINKPNGQFVLPRDRASIMRFMGELPIRKVNGIGRVLERELQEIGVSTCGDIYKHRQYLKSLFGNKAFDFLLGCYLGIGRTRIRPARNHERKSVGTESTFRETSDPLKLRDKLRCLATDLEQDMRRAECKGRTLCLKVKLDTFEVVTRQIATPKVIGSADDLYAFSLPLLSKLEQEMPDWKLRLMGLRCTNLISTKRPDAVAFFGLKKRKLDNAKATALAANKDDVMSETKSDDRCGKPAVEKNLSYGGPLTQRGETHLRDSTTSRPSENSMPSYPKENTRVDEDWWDCPVCFRPQQPDQRALNDHIDLCLSRQTIRDAVQDQEAWQQEVKQPILKRQFIDVRKGAKASVKDPKQRRLCFAITVVDYV
ncbi:hypothetical protein E4U09_007537 [Claviceps aff. purpurea]|uniref:DNA polymerase kappa n=1 Tax=Claviceps aff. purpurea TaxID=1967640 RepID=A0A9P7QBE8_9HYPO|nr:hypothetical protein E4U09_007537 [Claviceps aff. purpurea]